METCLIPEKKNNLDITLLQPLCLHPSIMLLLAIQDVEHSRLVEVGEFKMHHVPTKDIISLSLVSLECITPKQQIVRFLNSKPD